MNTHIALKNTETDAMFIVPLDQGQKMMAEHSTVLKRATPQDLQDGGCSDRTFKECGLDKPVVDVEVTDKPVVDVEVTDKPNLTNNKVK